MRIESVRSGAPGVATVAAGGSSFTLRLQDAEAQGLDPARIAPGTDLLEAEEELLSLLSESYAAEKRALALIAISEHSRLTLILKLEKRGFSQRAAGLAVSRLHEVGLVDDRRFARLFASARLRRRAEGPSTLVAALRDRGVDADTASSVVSELIGRQEAPEDRLTALAKAARQALKKTKGDEDRARERLRELGFHTSEIRDFFSNKENT